MANLMSRLPRGWRAAQRPPARRPVRANAAARGMAPRLAALLGAFCVGALSDRFILDRTNARRRRHVARERGLAKLRRCSRQAVRRAKYTEGVAEGVAHRAAHAMPGVGTRKEPLDDVSLAHKVEGEAFRQAGVPKAHVSVNAERGVVYLRGRLDSEREIQELVRAAGAVHGVKRVENKLHTPHAAASEQGS